MKEDGLGVELVCHVTKRRVLEAQHGHMDLPVTKSGINAMERCTRSMPGGKIMVISYNTRMMSDSIMSRDETGYHTGKATCIVIHVLVKLDPPL